MSLDRDEIRRDPEVTEMVNSFFESTAVPNEDLDVLLSNDWRAAAESIDPPQPTRNAQGVPLDLDLEFAKQLADPNFSLSVPAPAKVVIRSLVAEVERLRAQIEAVRAATANHPAPCEKHPDGDAVTCGWKSAYRDVVRALEVGE